jgi:orotidine-5'-phosphate decarboxylase
MKPATLAAIRRVRWHWPAPRNEAPDDGSPYVIDCRAYDITNTVSAMIRNAPPGLAAVTVSPRGGIGYVAKVERTARQRGARVLWWPM